jgi:hypothetical protein
MQNLFQSLEFESVICNNKNPIAVLISGPAQLKKTELL